VKVLHLNTYLHGGAATAARRLHDALVRQGVDSRFCYAEGPAPGASYFPYFTGARARAWRASGAARRWLRLAPWLLGRPPGYEIFSDSRWMLPSSLEAMPFRPDIVHLHWTADFLDYVSLPGALPAEAPLVWTLHDMHPFTGGCHYSYSCDKFATACGECMQLNGLRSPRDPSWQNLALKRDALRGRNLHVVADSRWLEAQARRSAVLASARSFRTIHYGLDVAAYAPRPKAACRARLGLAEDVFVVCFGAPSLASPRKGLRELLAALQQLRDVPRLACLVFGGELPAGTLDGLPAVRALGYLDGAEAQATAYSAADVFVIPSLQEAFGQTSLEAMACSTPVIGFDTGGIPDMVRPGETGLLAPVGDVAALAEALRWAAGHRAECAAMGANARRLAESEFTLERQAAAYLALYGSL
jgi:glycosyltransferase involved in cell wall biosynthesis